MSGSQDGAVNIEVSGDEMQAVAFIMPPVLTGKAVDVPDVKRALKQAGVVFGIVNNERIASFCEEGRLMPVDFLAAAGSQPGAGEDASITYTWMKDDAKAIDDVAKIDFRELNIVKSVKGGDVIAVRKPPTRGQEGVTVTGKKTPGEWGSDVSVKAGANVTSNPDNTQFIAALDGSPKLSDNTVSVDPVYRIAGDVDYSTGNINFAGALEIKGNVQDGFVVKAEGNISIGGNVQAAEVISGGDVAVAGGIITRHEGTVYAKGTISAKFIENSVVEADSDVIADRAIINSKVRSNNRIICTSREGKIMGGDIMAFHEIRAKHLGTEKETATVLRAGFKFDVFLKLAALEEKLAKILFESERIRKSLSSTKIAQGDAAMNMKKTLAQLDAQKVAIQQHLAAMRSKVQVNPFATVKGEEFIHPGAVIYIGGARERVAKALKFATLSADKEGGIALSAYDELSRSVKTTSVGSKEKQKTVLVVDDAKFMRNKLRNILENANFKVVAEAEDGRDAVALYNKHKPDVVTMDITMPNVDGITSLRAIKKLDPKARVVMISALGQKDKVRDSIIAGAMDFVIKPFIPEKVVEIIARIAGKDQGKDAN
jgi:hypothetical protein